MSIKMGHNQFSPSGGGVIDFSGLQTVEGGGRTFFSTVDPDSPLSLPNLESANNVAFTASGGSTLSVAGTRPVSYSSAGYWPGGTMFAASGLGTLVDLSAIKSINAAFNDGSGGVRVQSFAAANGGTLRLSGVQSLVAPARSEDRLDFSAAGGNLIVGEFRNVSGAGGVRILINDATSSLVAPGSFKPAAKVLVEAEDESRLRIGQDYSFTHTDESKLLLGSAIVQLDGTGDQYVENGGFDIGTIVPANDNFGFGQLIVGQTNRSTTAHLRDAVDNDNLHDLCGTNREALYLFGLPGDPNGLRILGGSTLALDGLEVYASINGVMTRIRDLFPNDVDKIAFDGGWIQKGPLLPIEELPDADADGSPDIDDNCALHANDQTDTDGDGYGDECDADLNNDGVANETDMGIFAGEFGVTNCNGLTCLSDLDGDGDVDGDDLLMYIKIGPFTLGPACPPPI